MSRRPAALILLPLLAVLLAVSGLGPSGAANAETAARPHRVAQARVVFEVSNTNESATLCSADDRPHVLRGTLVGPAAVIEQRDAVFGVNVLVHDAGTGGWFWHLPGPDDYARQLARAGQTSLVLDRLGYDTSPLRNGDDTCLGAQVSMLHQVVQELRAGKFRYARSHDSVLPASHVLLQGHGTGATIAQLEASTFHDVAGLVVMSAPTLRASNVARQLFQQQMTSCENATYAPFGSSATQFRELLFRTASPAIQRAAAARRNPTPCGDVFSGPGAVLTAAATAGQVRVPVLRLTGTADRRSSSQGPAIGPDMTSRLFRGIGSALPLERNAPQVRATVLRWLSTIAGF